MKLTTRFTEFLQDTVNMNRTRLDTLEYSVSALESFIKESSWEPRVWKFESQGSWAAHTIIKPIEGRAYDADLLAVVAPVSGWNASDYVQSLYEIFTASRRYSDKVQRHDYCVTIDYVGERSIDIAPCVRGRLTDGQHEVCNGNYILELARLIRHDVAAMSA